MSDIFKPKYCGKTIEGLIRELQSFEDKSLMVEISLDDAVTTHPINLVVREGGMCVLIHLTEDEIGDGVSDGL